MMASVLTEKLIAQMREISEASPKLEGLVAGNGSRNPKFILVSEAPGKNEAREGIGFIGPAGQELQDWLNYLGLTRDQIYMTGTVRARPFNERNGVKRDRPPTKLEIKEFAKFLDYELQHLNSDLIVPMGNTGLQRLLGNDAKITQLHGQILHRRIREYSEEKDDFILSEKEWTLIPTFHPSYVRRFPNKNRPLVMNDLKIIKDYLN